jgi:hypothetical protein
MNELIKVIKLRDRHEDLAFWHNGEKGEIIHSCMVADGEGCVDYDFDVVSAETAMDFIDLYGIQSQEIYA